MANEIIFLMGLPASGKSTIADHHFSDRFAIDADLFKTATNSHMDSVAIAERKTVQVITRHLDKFLIDGTGGATGSTMVSMMKLAKAHDFIVRLVYVRCDVKTCLERNSKRERRVPTAVIENKATRIESIFAKVKPYADRVEIIETN